MTHRARGLSDRPIGEGRWWRRGRWQRTGRWLVQVCLLSLSFGERSVLGLCLWWSQSDARQFQVQVADERSGALVLQLALSVRW